MKKVIGLMLSAMLIGIGGYLIYSGAIKPHLDDKKEVEQLDNTPKQMLSAGEVFEAGKYIIADGVEI